MSKQIIGGITLTEKDIKLKIIENAETIAKEIKRGKDIEIKTSNGGLKILSADKRVVR